MSGSLDYLVGDVAAGSPEEDHLLGPPVHHVEEGLEANPGVTLKQVGKYSYTVQYICTVEYNAKYNKYCSGVTKYGYSTYYHGHSITRKLPFSELDGLCYRTVGVGLRTGCAFIAPSSK